MEIRNRTIGWSTVGLLTLGAATGFTAPGLYHTQVGAPVQQADDATVALVTAPNYRAIVARNQAAVVGITTAGDIPVAGEHGLSHAQGSGFLIAADGLIMTNAHVVEGAKTVTVKLSDHREFKAKVLGKDKISDIAILKIDAHDLATVRLGNSDQIHVGDYVLAIGEPFGLEETATAGIVSAKGRSLPGDGYVPFIQTDAAVNPGNSGGPLFSSDGSVVGINSQIYSNSGSFQGVSFAIPINVAVQIKDQIVKTGKVSHARLGIQVQTLDQSLADSFKMPAPNGALVAKVEPDSAAARAGVQVGDIITRIAGEGVTDAGQLSARVGATAPGDRVALELWRAGKTVQLDATVGAAEAAGMTAAANTGAAGVQLGLALRPLNSEERQQAGVSGGLLVEESQGRAAEAGIQPGDLLLSVNGSPVRSIAELRGLLTEHDKPVALLVQRGEHRLFVPVELS